MRALRASGLLSLSLAGLLGGSAACDGTGRRTDSPPANANSDPRAQLFPPDKLSTLEAPDRAAWQQPERVMDALNIADSSRVADIGAGGGWFTAYLARRVGPNGVVYAEDVQPPMIDAIKRRIKADGLTNVHIILGAPDDPRLPPGLHAVLLIDTYPQLPDPVALLRHAAAALAPGGRIGVVDFKNDGSGGPGPPIEHRVAPEVVVKDAQNAGLQLASREAFLRYQYVLVFTKSGG
jgi:predicted methyltransferase